MSDSSYESMLHEVQAEVARLRVGNAHLLAENERLRLELAGDDVCPHGIPNVGEEICVDCMELEARTP